MSMIQVSHRSKWFDDGLNAVIEKTKRLLILGDDFKVLFMEGGANLHFFMIPMHLSLQGKPVGPIP